eukprot:TRINITY_DN47272_c0_g1_i1.p1 TRINITY_DN47272_c0_g1~~TRINITY_DN47272_c0_g1_i1.p1  ORF type:complete len:472 (+),score=62.26 TRINITY_DN47272_c0_g1_i1:833-2248(+)
MAPSEQFLQGLLVDIDEIDLLKKRVRTALNMCRFQEASALEDSLLRGSTAVRSVIESRAIPVLLEGVLLIGNYVNASSSSLGGAIGITLESLAQLANTRCKSERSTQHVNALQFVVLHLQHTNPNFLQALATDLDPCRRAREVDSRTLKETVDNLTKQVQTVEELAKDCGSPSSDGKVPEAFSPLRLQTFLEHALPKIKRLAKLVSDVEQATKDLQLWFAEPESTPLSEMLGKLTRLRDALPVEEQTRSSVRHGVSRKSVLERARQGRRTSESVASENSDVATPDADGASCETASVKAPGTSTPDKAEPEMEGFENALKQLQDALAYIQTGAAGEVSSTTDADGDSSSASAVTPREAEAAPCYDDFDGPLATLQSVIERLNSSTAARDGRSAAAPAANAATINKLETLDEDSFEEPLAALESVLLKAGQPVNPRPRPRVASHNEIAEDAIKAFQAPLAELEGICALLRPTN